MHILLIHQVFTRLSDAGGTRHAEFARHLAARGHRVTVVSGERSYLTGESLGAPRREQLEPGVVVIRTPVRGGGQRTWPSRSAGFLSFMISAFRAGLRVPAVDLVWGTSPPLQQAVSAWAVAAARRVPWVFEVRDLWPEFAVAVGVLRNPLWIAIARWWESFLYRHADRLIVNSPAFTAHLVSRGAEAARIVSIPNGVDPGMFDPQADGADFRRRHGMEGKFVALYAGAHGLSNDLTVLLQAAEKLMDEPQIVVALVGDGREKPALVAEASRRGLANVRFLPAQPKSAMGTVLAAADCGIAILKAIRAYRTTYPNKVFDYMAAGRPVVLAIDGAVREVVEAARAGVAVPPGDAAALAEAVRRLARDRDQARAMGRNGREHVVAHFSRAALAQTLEATLQSVGGG
ncbi:MAG: glycosyltransferase family 4 protein [Gemmatimonadales bacterium]